MAENPAQSLVGRQVGPYKIHSLLGVGGMGEVYLAQDPRLVLPQSTVGDWSSTPSWESTCSPIGTNEI